MFQFLSMQKVVLLPPVMQSLSWQQFYLQLQPLFSPERNPQEKIKYQTAGLLLYGFSMALLPLILKFLNFLLAVLLPLSVCFLLY